MKIPLKLSHQIMLLVMIPIFIELIFISDVFLLSQQLDRGLRAEVRGRKLISDINTFHSDLSSGADACGQFMIYKSVDAVNKYRHYQQVCKLEVAALKPVLAVRTARPADLQELDLSFAQVEEKTQALMDGVVTEPLPEVGRRSVAAKIAADDLLAVINRLGAQEQKLLDAQVAEIESQKQAVSTALLVGVVLNIIMAVVAGLAVSRTISRRVSILIENSRRIAAGKTLSAPLSGSDELAELDSVLRTMSSELALAAGRQQSILDNTSEIICSLNDAKVFTMVNPAAELVWGYRPEQLLGQRCLTLVAHDDQQLTNDAFASASAGSVATFENVVVKADGQLADMSWSVHWVAQEKSYFCVVHDISERKELERLKLKVVSIVSHDLRSPLMSLQIKLELLAEGDRWALPAEVVEDLHNAEKNVNRMIGLTNDLLDLQKMKSGKWVMHYRKTSLLAVLRQSVEAIRSLAEVRNIAVNLPEEDTIFVGDGERITQVVVNILANSLKFAPAGQPVSITVCRTEQTLEVQITDRGPGISDQDQSVIFEPFQQVAAGVAAEVSSKGSVKGSGLGLSICREIIAAHGGNIGVRSELGQGSTFWFRIPLQQKASHAVV